MNSPEYLDGRLCEIVNGLGLVYENKRNVVDNPLCDCGTIKTKGGKVLMKISLSDLRFKHTFVDEVARITEMAKAEKEKAK